MIRKKNTDRSSYETGHKQNSESTTDLERGGGEVMSELESENKTTTKRASTRKKFTIANRVLLTLKRVQNRFMNQNRPQS